jgi:transcriptional regulator with XRE-family HTH domain
MPSLRELRERKFLSQRDLAKAAGVSTFTIWELEGAKARPRRGRTIRKLAKALGVEPSEIEIPTKDQVRKLD